MVKTALLLKIKMPIIELDKSCAGHGRVVDGNAGNDPPHL
jgi:hypothetical protein